MAFYDTTWYTNFGNGTSTGYYAVTVRPQNTAVAAGVLRRQFTAPAVGSERVFVCIVAGTTANTTDATWVLTRGAKTTDGTATWQECTGASAVNGDLTNTPTWAQARAISTAVTLGAIVQRNNGASYWICSTAGTLGASEPAWSNNTAGTTQADGTTTWTCLGAVGNFTGGQAPHARLANACASTWFAAGNTVYVGDNHAETQSTAMTIGPLLTAATVGKIICHNHSGSYPPASTDLTVGATISTTASGANLTFSPVGGSIYIYGLAFQAGVGVSASAVNLIITSTGFAYFDNCVFKLASTNAAASIIQIGAANAPSIVWNNTTVSFGVVADYIDSESVNFIWQNTGQILVSGSAVPTGLIGALTNSRLSSIVLEALDLSQLTGNLLSQNATLPVGYLTVKDCKLNGTMAVATPTFNGQTVQLVRSDSAATAYKSARYSFEGSETTETSVTRVGGAVDPSGQAQSRKIVTTANSQWLRPFRAEPYAIWNTVTGANVTVTVYGIIAGALPLNDEIFMEVEYLSSGSPLGAIVTTTKSNLLASNASVSADSSSWNNMTNATLDGAATNVTMSNGNLTATHPNTILGGVASTAFVAAGKYYFEITPSVSFSPNNTIGIIIPTLGVTTGGVTGTTYVTVSASACTIFADGVNMVRDLGGFIMGNVFGVAVDLTAGRVWFRKANNNWNNDASANPATGIGGFAFSAGSYAPWLRFINVANNTDVMTANFGQSPYAGTIPLGFGNWPVTQFKLVATLSSPQPGMAGAIEARIRAAKPSATYYIDPLPVLT